MVYYHGTSFENYKLMLNGNKQIKKNWKESEDKMYFWINMENAYNAAVTCAAITNSQAPLVIILKIDLDESIINIDNSDGHGEHYGLSRICIDYSNFNINKAEIIPSIYYPEKRAKYLYNHYHCTCALNWDSIKDFVINSKEIEKECDLLYEELLKTEKYSYEYHFKEIEDINIGVKDTLKKLKYFKEYLNKEGCLRMKEQIRYLFDKYEEDSNTCFDEIIKLLDNAVNSKQIKSYKYFYDEEVFNSPGLNIEYLSIAWIDNDDKLNIYGEPLKYLRRDFYD